ncbi:response regulator [Actinophytocola gossypii]|uniref:Transcriptional regulatory protein n=1 Tax=Actinophytocola gossypii TaxID=2812003 RepID=A0ABT2JGJ0_9PSEU|nr:response regulator [Actinophytocola gossypii]MCT2586992.1 response regulator [Actinophytocola gossypii]
MINVLVVEDDPVAADAHRLYVSRVPGFAVVGVVHSAGEAQRALAAGGEVDLLLLDQYLPDGTGLDLCRTLRAGGLLVDVIMVTSARDLAVVRAAVSIGVVQYLLKPFTFATLREKLERYARFRRSVDRSEAADQTDVDHLFATLRGTDTALPKGMSGPTLDAVAAVLRDAEDGLSAGAAGDVLGMSRVTARRYLEYLADNGLAVRQPRYGQVGRPELRYQWTPT